MKSNNEVTIYGCGGCGIELASKYANTTINEFIARPNFKYVDTTQRNLASKPFISNENVFSIPGLDGSAKRRDMNYPIINRHIPQILEKLPPTDVNILIFSSGGGSGSVIGPLLMAELQKMGKTTIIIMVGSYESDRTCYNSLRTWETLNGLGQNGNFCPIVIYDSNGAQSHDSSVDGSMVSAIAAILDLYSGTHQRLDTADVQNMFSPVRSFGAKPEVLLMDISTKIEEVHEINYPLAVAAIVNDIDDYKSVPAQYNCEGIRVLEGIDLFFTVHNDGLSAIIRELKSAEAEYIRKEEGRSRASENLFGASNGGDGSGISF